MLQGLWKFLGFIENLTGPEFRLPTHHKSSNEKQWTPLVKPACSGLSDWEVTFLPVDGNLILNLNTVPGFIRTPKISIPPAERSKLTLNTKFNPITVANLWLQLLLIHSFNGNFIHYSYPHYPGNPRIEDIKSYNDHGGPFQVTKLSEIQCDRLRDVAARAELALHGSVIDLYCLFSYAHETVGVGAGEYQIIPKSTWPLSPFPLPKRLLPPFPRGDVEWNIFREWPREEFVERRFYESCPLLPSTWFKLTEWTYGDQGIFSVIDVESGVAFEVVEGDPMKCVIDVEGQTGVAWREQDDPELEWEVVDPPPMMKRWKVRPGSEKPVEVFLKTWITKFLDKEWIAMPHQPMITEEDSGPRRVEMKRLLQDFGWPSNFPLEINRYREFLTRVKQIQEGDWAALLNVTHIWSHFEKARRKWYDQNFNPFDVDQNELGSRQRGDERVEAIDDVIWKIVTRERQAERAKIYAELNEEELDQCFGRGYEMESMQNGGFAAFGRDEVVRRWRELRELAMEESEEMDMIDEVLRRAYGLENGKE